jgi:diguanylate cyclase (GGDEF)-like protein
MRILVIEDDELTAQALTTILTTHHYAVEVAKDGKAGLALLDSFEYDLLILDVGLPDMDGIEVCRQVRTPTPTPPRSQTSQLPILLLTAHDNHHDRAVGLDAGADDYVVKPFNEEELVARIRALLRRASSTATPFLEWGDLQFNPSTCEVTYQSTPISLTPKEYGLLELFLRNNRRVFSCDNILEHLWTYDSPGEEAVRTHIKGLRKRLKAAGAPSDFIETVYGIGYRLKPITSVSVNTSGENASREQELRSKLSTVWNRHQERIGEQILVIEKVAYQTDLNLQPQAIQQAHTLAGSLGSFGFTEGSRLAREIEQLLKGQFLTSKDFNQLRDLTVSLRRAIDIPTSSNNSAHPEPLTLKPTANQPLILLVSRDRTWTQTLEKEMPLWNYQGAIASTPKAVTRICENESPSLVLLDLECFESIEEAMKILSTFQLQYPPIPAIVLTTHNELTERLEVSRHGGRLLLQKSTSVPQILEAVAQVVQRVSQTQAKILVVDDDFVLLDALVTLLEPWGLKVFTLNDPNRFWEALEAIDPDVLVLDIELPDFSGIELCQVVRNDLNWSHLPIVVLTAHSEPETISHAFAAGADDFVSKPIAGAELVARLLSRLERVKLLRQLLETDQLTGVASRQKSTQELDSFLESSNRSHQPVLIAVLDIDQLRDINEKYGHATGDLVLRQFGQLLRQSFCNENVVARWGGEEFVIGMYGMTREEGVQHLVQVSEKLTQQAFLTEDGEPVQVMFSSGVAQYPEDGADLKALYLRAESALRQEKSRRREIKDYDTISLVRTNRTPT